jgi:hypothetical protein
VSDDWRLTVEVDTGAEGLQEALRAVAPDGVDVTRSDDTIHVYAAAREPIERTVDGTPAAGGVLERYHWERGWIDPASWTEPPPEPVREAIYEWAVVIRLDPYDDARQLAWDLHREGLPVSRWRHQVTAGGMTEDEAHLLAARLEPRFRAGTRIDVQIETQAQGAAVSHDAP